MIMPNPTAAIVLTFGFVLFRSLSDNDTSLSEFF
jgi:hypothetical protein